MEERVLPIKITDNETGTTYELDFNKDAVALADRRKFDLDDVQKFPGTKIPELFYYSFRMHHRNMSETQTNDILYNKLGGLSGEMLARLMQLFDQARLSNNIQSDEDLAKNSRMTVEM